MDCGCVASASTVAGASLISRQRRGVRSRAKHQRRTESLFASTTRELAPFKLESRTKDLTRLSGFGQWSAVKSPRLALCAFFFYFFLFLCEKLALLLCLQLCASKKPVLVCTGIANRRIANRREYTGGTQGKGQE